MRRVSDGGRYGVLGRWARADMAERLGGFVYGTIVVLAVIVTGAKAYPDDPGYVAALVVVTTGVFWLAHVYSHALARSVNTGTHLHLRDIREIARHESAIVEAGGPSIVALLLGTLGLLSASASYWLAVGLGLVVLATDGIIFARVERLGRVATIGVVATNIALGLVLVALKVVVTH
jgi:hypothetical protein